MTFAIRKNLPVNAEIEDKAKKCAASGKELANEKVVNLFKISG